MRNKNFYLVIGLIFVLGVILRVVFSPPINFETDSFSVLLSAKNIAEAGRYLIPPVRLTDGSGYQPFPGWAVGCPLTLAVFFKLLGYSEALARLLTILAASAVIPIIGLLGNRLYGEKSGIIAAIFVALNPFLICINSRILTINFSFCFFTISIALLLLSALSSDKTEFISAQVIFSSVKRWVLLLVSFLFLGFTLGTRDDYAMFVFVFIIILAAIVKASYKQAAENRRISLLKLFLLAAALTFIGYLPNIYFNFVNYGRFITSSHYEYGGRLSLEYFLHGPHTGLGLPGWIVMLLAVFIYVFPIMGIFLLNFKSKANLLLVAMIFLIILPVILIAGAYFTASSGGAPRYILPVIPFVLLSAGAVFATGGGPVRYFLKSIFLTCLIFWNVILFYPPVVLFKAYPKIAYLTQYSPWYNLNNFLNYPHPVKTMLAWVKSNTAADAVILSDYDSYHYFFYAQRDIASRDNLMEVKKILTSRPVFFIEDHQTLKDPVSFSAWAQELSKYSISMEQRYSLPLFSPLKGQVQLKIYELINK
ncbi:MAG: hypothetical protein PHS66_00560 [Candidatus Omnitrophica bacterium]|nr:hypothetical protein [Candidatus Omnitrophota bacterium]